MCVCEGYLYTLFIITRGDAKHSLDFYLSKAGIFWPGFVVLPSSVVTPLFLPKIQWREEELSKSFLTKLFFIAHVPRTTLHIATCSLSFRKKWFPNR